MNARVVSLVDFCVRRRHAMSGDESNESQSFGGEVSGFTKDRLSRKGQTNTTELKNPRVSKAKAKAFPTNGVQYGTGGGSSLIAVPLIPSADKQSVAV